MGQEIERKWLIDKTEIPPAVSAAMKDGTCAHAGMVQGYLCVDPVIRVRQEGDTWYLTYKGKGRLSREEYNLPLNAAAFAALLSKCEGLVLVKDRYRIPMDNTGLVIELDIFHQEYEGLVYAEVEFASREEAAAFLPPDWFGREVTYENGYSNASLALANGGSL